MIHIGVIGCGAITVQRHAPEYAANDQCAVTAWFDLQAKKARAMADTYGGRVYTDWRELILKGQCDAVSVCTPNIYHAEISIFALEHGLHVLCEKPMAVSLQECKKMVDAAARSGKLLYIDQNQRLEPSHQMARQMIAEGKLGKILTFQTNFCHAGPEVWSGTVNPWFFDGQKAGFGAVFDLGIHKVDLVRFLLNDEVAEAVAFEGTLDKRTSGGKPISVDDNAMALLRMQGGAMGQIMVGWTDYGHEINSERIFCTNGVLHVNENANSSLVWETPDGKETVLCREAIQTNQSQSPTGVIDSFIQCIVEGHPAEIAGSDVLRSMKIVFALLESMKTHCCVSTI